MRERERASVCVYVFVCIRCFMVYYGNWLFKIMALRSKILLRFFDTFLSNVRWLKGIERWQRGRKKGFKRMLRGFRSKEGGFGSKDKQVKEAGKAGVISHELEDRRGRNRKSRGEGFGVKGDKRKE